MRCANCGLDASNLIAYFDGELAPELDRLVAERVARCTACERRLRQMSETRGVLRERTPLPADLAARAAIRSRLAVEARRPAARWRRPAIAVMTLPVVLLLALLAADRLPAMRTLVAAIPGCERCAGLAAETTAEATAPERRASGLALAARPPATVREAQTIYRDPRSGATTIVATRQVSSGSPEDRRLARQETRIVQLSPRLPLPGGCPATGSALCAVAVQRVSLAPSWFVPLANQAATTTSSH
jgi:anti-sigma factor RsiW